MIKNINLIKFIGIFIVVLIHFGPILYAYEDKTLSFNMFLVYRSFLSIGVPILLLTSGYLLIEKTYSIKKIMKRILHVFILIIIFKIIYALAFTYSLPSFKDLIYALTTTGANGYRVNSLWYLYALIAIYFLLPFFTYIAKNKKLYNYLVILLISYPVFFNIIEIIFNAKVDYKMQIFQSLYPFQTQYLFAIAAFVVGGWFKLNKNKLQYNFKASYVIIIVVVLLVLQSILALLLTNTSEVLFDPMYDGYATFTCFINSCLIFYILKFQIKSIDNKFINFVANNTLGIYLIHWPIAYYIKTPFMKNPIINSYLDNILLTIIVFFISLFISYLLQKNKLTAKLVKF